MVQLIHIDRPEELPLPIISVCGSSEERGYQYGSQVKHIITESIHTYKKIAASLRPDHIDWAEMKAEARDLIAPIKRYDRELFLELQGIARGSGVPLEDIVFLNARSEIMNPAWAGHMLSEGCTSFIAQPSATKYHEYFIGQTYDWYPACKELLVMLHSRDEKGLEFVTVTEAGMVCKIGCNNYGIANTLNYLNNFEVNRSGALYNILLRRILDSHDFYQAQRNIMRSPIAFGLNTLFADRKGPAIDYELTANGIDFFQPVNGLLIHTNHYLSDKLSVRTFNKGLYPNSLNRYKTAERMLDGKLIELDDILRTVSFHHESDTDSTLCRHACDNADNIESIFTMVVELIGMKLYLCIGTPCDHAFYGIALDRLFREMRV